MVLRAPTPRSACGCLQLTLFSVLLSTPCLFFAPTPFVHADADFDTELLQSYDNILIDVVLPTMVAVRTARGVGLGDASIIMRWNTMTHVAWYDAVAPYHPTAVGVFTDLGRRPDSESVMDVNIIVATIYASHKIWSWFAPDEQETWDAMLTDLGLDPTDVHEGDGDAIAIGNAAAAGVIAAREADGFNQAGTNGRTFNPQPYADYTGYAPVNTAYELRDARRWQPQFITDPLSGLSKVQSFVTPQWRLTTPFSYPSAEAFSAPEPTKSYDVANDVGTAGATYQAQADAVLKISADLTEEQKLLAEFFDNKGVSLGASNSVAFESQGLSLMNYVLLDLVTALAVHDSGIVVWQEKTRWDAVRPFSAIAKLYAETEITAYGGPGVGTVATITGTEWSPYLQTADHPEYPSASASFCAAHAEGARLFLGNDTLGYSFTWEAGDSTVEPGITPEASLTFTFETWTDFETICGDSRVFAGVHFPDAVPAGQEIGAEIGALAYEFVMDHVNNEGVGGNLQGSTSRKMM